MARQPLSHASNHRTAVATGPDFRRLFEGASCRILALAPDSTYTILGASDAYVAALLTERDRIVGRGLFEIVPDDPVDLRASLERLLAGRASAATAVERCDIRWLGKEGDGVEERHWSAVNSIVLSAAGEVRYIVHRLEDVTDFVWMSRRADQCQARAEALNAELEQADRELDSFSYSVSHDLRAPLRAIDGFARILKEDYGNRLDDEGMRVLSVILESSERMGRLIEDVLAFSRLGRTPLSIEAIDMSRAAREAFQQVCADAPRMPELVLRPLPAARGDAALMQQVWTHLLGNAFKFSGPREHAAIEVSARESGAEYVYSVRDNGVGFDMRYYDKLFGMFQRLHPEAEFPGAGIGLAIVQRIVARHRGRVWAEGAPGRGATFCFTLPNRMPTP